MSAVSPTRLPEREESLWRMIVSPSVWAVHFLLCYGTAAIWCAKYVPRSGTLAPVRWLIAGYTGAALAIIAANAWSGLRRHRHGAAALPHDADTPQDRHRFLGFATLLLAGLSAIAVVFAALAALYLEDCR